MHFWLRMDSKVGFAAKVHAEENADDPDGEFFRVSTIVTQQNEYVGDMCRMYRNFGSAQATTFLFHKCLFSLMFKLIFDSERVD